MTSSRSIEPRASIIIPCRNEVGAIEVCLRSVLAQDAPEGGFEVIVADGMSDDGTRQIVEKLQTDEPQRLQATGPQDHGTTVSSQRSVVGDPSSAVSGQWSVVCGPSLRLIDNPGKIVSTGLNAAIRAARGDIIIRLDAHTEYSPDYLVQCVAALTRFGADNVGGPARTKAETFLGKGIAAAYHSPFAVGGARFHNVDYEGYVDTVTYGCWRKESFEKFGHFDETLVRNQDDEHNLRIVRGGGKIWQSPKIKSWYKPRGSLSALFRQYMQYGYWKVRVIQKHKLPASWRHLVPGAFVFVLMLLALCSLLFAVFNGTTDHGQLTTDLYRLPADLLIGLLGFYGLCVFFASVLTAAKSEWKLFPVLPLAFACYHFGYGWGFLRGILDFILLRRGAGHAFTGLTRESKANASHLEAVSGPQAPVSSDSFHGSP